MMRRIFFVLSILMFTFSGIFAQTTPSKFYELIQNDSVRMFFNKSNQFIGKDCSDFVRYCKIDSDGNFNGRFIDYDNKGGVQCKGFYLHGKKHGYYELYHSNGNLKCCGTYCDNFPVGKWEYYYANGSPKKILIMSKTETLLLRYFDEKGKCLVDKGRGEYVGCGGAFFKDITISGGIRDGKPDGEWLASIMKGLIHCKEEYKMGTFVSGVFPHMNANKPEAYHDESYLNHFFEENYLSELEEFRVQKCFKSSRQIFAFGSSKFENFKSDLRSNIKSVITRDLNSGNFYNYNEGDNNLSIIFSVDDNGGVSTPGLISSWGRQFVDVVSSAIRMPGLFPKAAQTIYFHMKLKFIGKYTYQYEFQFSNDRIPSLGR